MHFRWFPEIYGIVCFMALFELAGRTGIFPQQYVPLLSDILVQFKAELSRVQFWNALYSTLLPWFYGLTLSLIIALPVGAIIGLNRNVFRILMPVVEFLRPIPPVALIPVAVLMYGNTLSMKVFLIVLGCIWPLLIQTIYGLRELSPVAKDMARVYKINPLSRFINLYIPAALPNIFSGLKIACTIALILAVGAEIVVGVAGIGSEINLAQSSGNNASAYALIIFTGLIGIVINVAVRAIQRKFLFWQPEMRSVEKS